ncbi:DUF5522 domain-containing protein [Chitinophaga cymbidii]|uniref:Uncharacterized protein n=1 Tax=Chitinophaga cymbidii TaxID=1096750 RepID=A0A512RGM9_9BACT|nr:DUF5522 domain-containing protein [Chitinophaga cymbidii]GEP94857.1 hypothetical protein CCY01nite_11170 [Chitinophaga cymbidii]
MKTPLQENIDFYYNEQGLMVLTEKYHRDRGYCCGKGCLHCPFDYENVPEDKKSRLREARRQRENGEGRG